MCVRMHVCMSVYVNIRVRTCEWAMLQPVSDQIENEATAHTIYEGNYANQPNSTTPIKKIILPEIKIFFGQRDTRPRLGGSGGGAYRAKWRVKSDCLHSAPKRSDVSSLSMCLLVLGWRQRLRFNHYGIVCVFYRFFYVILRNV